jgi:hypothetical protein
LYLFGLYYSIMNKQRSLAILNLAGGGLVLAVNSLANALPINGLNTGEVSRLYPNLFVPAGFTFSIWSVIYLLMLGFMALSVKWLWNAPTLKPGLLATDISPWFLITCILNSGWIMLWHYLQIGLSVIVMLLFLATLIHIYLKLQKHRKGINGNRKVFLYNFFAVYLGWISVATIANITAWLVSLKWSGFGIDPAYFSLTMIAIAIGLAIVFISMKREQTYGWVIAWALFGIYAEQSRETPAIGSLALGGVILIVIFALVYLYLHRSVKVS